jgi:hypothetical protein
MSSFSLFTDADPGTVAVVGKTMSSPFLNRRPTLSELPDVMPASRLEVRPAREMASTGIPAIDGLTGGFPRGCLTEICGAVSSGRTSLQLAALAAATRRQETCALVDAGDAFDPRSGATAGIDFERKKEKIFRGTAGTSFTRYGSAGAKRRFRFDCHRSRRRPLPTGAPYSADFLVSFPACRGAHANRARGHYTRALHAELRRVTAERKSIAKEAVSCQFSAFSTKFFGDSTIAHATSRWTTGRRRDVTHTDRAQAGSIRDRCVRDDSHQSWVNKLDH